MEKSRRLACAMFTRPRTGGWDSTQLTSVNNPPLSALCWGVLRPATLCFLWCCEQCLLQTLRWVQCLQSLSLFARGKYSGPTNLFIFSGSKQKFCWLQSRLLSLDVCVADCEGLWTEIEDLRIFTYQENLDLAVLFFTLIMSHSCLHHMKVCGDFVKGTCLHEI